MSGLDIADLSDILFGLEVDGRVRLVAISLSAGRVQTAALRMIVDREREIEVFRSEEYWNLAARLAGSLPPELVAKASMLDGRKWKVSDGETAGRIVEELRNVPFVIKKIHRRQKKRYPVPPFITSKLQQEAARRFKRIGRTSCVVIASFLGHAPLRVTV